jgi:hypothetical protein
MIKEWRLLSIGLVTKSIHDRRRFPCQVFHIDGSSFSMPDTPALSFSGSAVFRH